MLLAGISPFPPPTMFSILTKTLIITEVTLHMVESTLLLFSKDKISRRFQKYLSYKTAINAPICGVIGFCWKLRATVLKTAGCFFYQLSLLPNDTEISQGS